MKQQKLLLLCRLKYFEKQAIALRRQQINAIDEFRFAIETGLQMYSDNPYLCGVVYAIGKDVEIDLV